MWLVLVEACEAANRPEMAHFEKEKEKHGEIHAKISIQKKISFYFHHLL